MSYFVFRHFCEESGQLALLDEPGLPSALRSSLLPSPLDVHLLELFKLRLVPGNHLVDDLVVRRLVLLLLVLVLGTKDALQELPTLGSATQISHWLPTPNKDPHGSNHEVRI